MKTSNLQYLSFNCNSNVSQSQFLFTLFKGLSKNLDTLREESGCEEKNTLNHLHWRESGEGAQCNSITNHVQNIHHHHHHDEVVPKSVQLPLWRCSTALTKWDIYMSVYSMWMMQLTSWNCFILFHDCSWIKNHRYEIYFYQQRNSQSSVTNLFWLLKRLLELFWHS